MDNQLVRCHSVVVATLSFTVVSVTHWIAWCKASSEHEGAVGRKIAMGDGGELT